MPRSVFLGEFEQLVLLSVMHLGDAAYVIDLRENLNAIAGRTVSRGSLYRTLDRLAEKGYVDWAVEEDVPGRSGHPRRNLRVTSRGREMLRLSRKTLLELWDGLEDSL